MDDNLKLNFIGSLLMTMLAAAILFGSLQIHLNSDGPLYSSPALMPGMLGGVLIVMSLLLLGQTIIKAGLQNSMVNARRWLDELVRLPYAKTTLLGLLLMAIYTFVLIHLLRFWAASLIFTVAMMLFLRAARWWMVLIISGALVGGLVLLFESVFRVPLP